MKKFELLVFSRNVPTLGPTLSQKLNNTFFLITEPTLAVRVYENEKNRKLSDID